MRGVTHMFHLAVAMREGGKSDEFFEAINLDGTRRSARGGGRGAGRAVRLLQHDRDLRPPGAGRHPRGIAAPARQHLRADQGGGRAPGAGAGAERRTCRSSILRPADVYGPRDQRLLKLFKGVSRGRFPLFGGGAGRRHMVYVDDVVVGLLRGLRAAGGGGRSDDRRGARGRAPCGS